MILLTDGKVFIHLSSPAMPKADVLYCSAE
jgi:hypothetical protein